MLFLAHSENICAWKLEKVHADWGFLGSVVQESNYPKLWKGLTSYCISCFSVRMCKHRAERIEMKEVVIILLEMNF